MGSLTQICLLRMDERDSGEGGKTSHAEALWEAVALGQRAPRGASGGVSRSAALLRHINGELTSGWRLPALSL